MKDLSIMSLFYDPDIVDYYFLLLSGLKEIGWVKSTFSLNLNVLFIVSCFQQQQKQQKRTTS